MKGKGLVEIHRTMGSALSCSQRTEEGDCLAWWTGSGMSGAPMTPSMSWSSPRLIEQGSPAPDRSAACDRIHALTLVQPNLEPREPPPPENISSGIGTSSTVSSASSRSRFGHSFLMGRARDEEALAHTAQSSPSSGRWFAASSTRCMA